MAISTPTRHAEASLGGTPALDPGAVRPRFPALARQEGGKPVLFFDGPAGSQVPASVISAITGYLEGSNANIEGAFAASVATDEMILRARAAAADLLGVDADEIAFGQNTTTLNFLLAHAVARTLAPGDEIVTTALDHDANIAPWLLVAADHDLVVRQAPLQTADGTLDPAAIEALIGERTRIVACTLASNALGTVPDAARIGRAAKAAGALFWVDAVHFAPHRRIDRDALGADVILTSAYKYFGPHLGVAAIRRTLAESWPADRVRPASETPAGHRFETGTLSHPAIAGFAAAVDYLDSLAAGPTRRDRLDVAFAAIRAHEEALGRRLLEGLADIPGVTVHGIADPARIAGRTPTFAFTVAGQTPRRVAEALAAEAIFVWDGNYYALAAMEALGLEEGGGAVRAGLLHYNTAEEVERFLAAVERVAAGSGRRRHRSTRKPCV